MQVVILCGGRGSRIADVTGGVTPKPMLPLGDRPILWHIMKHYSSFGHDRFVLCLGYLGSKIKEYFLHFEAMASDLTVRLGDRGTIEIHPRANPDEWEVTLAETGLETLTAGRLERIAGYLTEDNFLLTYGDGVADVDLNALEEFHVSHGKMLTVTGVVQPARFGEMHVEGPMVTRMQEKPEATHRRINGGFMMCRREFIDRFVAGRNQDVMLEREPFEDAARSGEMMMYRHDGFWQCMDTHRDWALLNDLWTAGKAPWKVWD